MSRHSLKARKALRSASAKKGWETRRAGRLWPIGQLGDGLPYPPPPFVMIHSTCGKPAFGLTERPHYGALGDSSIIRHLDGRPMKRNSLMVCESCGGSIGVPQSANVVPRPLVGEPTKWLLPAARAEPPMRDRAHAAWLMPLRDLWRWLGGAR